MTEQESKELVNVTLSDSVEREVFFEDNEVFISFGSDVEAFAFKEWWEKEGAAALTAYIARER